MDLNLLDDIRDRIGPAHMGKPALIGLVVVFILILAIAGTRFIGNADAQEFEIASGSQSSAQEAEGASPKTVFVHVAGAVNNPGLYEVVEGGRVAEAVQAAGGFSEEAAIDSVNLARIVSDGEQIVVARVATQDGGESTDEGIASSAQGMTTLININTASESDLESLPGIGPATASKIVNDRKSNGSFKTIEDLKRVSGIGDKKFESLKDLICV